MEMVKSSAKDLLEIIMMEHSAPDEEALPTSVPPESRPQYVKTIWLFLR
jgi:hypothetical protein